MKKRMDGIYTDQPTSEDVESKLKNADYCCDRRYRQGREYSYMQETSLACTKSTNVDQNAATVINIDVIRGLEPGD